jgi:hypothetical protein
VLLFVTAKGGGESLGLENLPIAGDVDHFCVGQWTKGQIVSERHEMPAVKTDADIAWLGAPLIRTDIVGSIHDLAAFEAG